MPHISKPLQVYIVEDSPIIRRLLASTVEAAGAQLIGQTGSADKAIAELSQMHPDLVVIDIGLRTGNGFDVLEALHRHHLLSAAIKVVFTNHASAEFEELSLKLGANRFFDKSSDTPEVLALISALAAETRGSAIASHGANRHEPVKRTLN
jgi:DNA-binding NarL/FixJ family response regulator